MTPLEKAARALFEADSKNWLRKRRWDDDDEWSSRKFYFDAARAVISSIEVDDAMVEVAKRKLYALGRLWPCETDEGKQQVRHDMRAALTASLRSILEDGAGR